VRVGGRRRPPTRTTRAVSTAAGCTASPKNAADQIMVSTGWANRRRPTRATPPGEARVPGEPEAAHLRLSYGAATPETLREGVARLGAALREVG